MALRNAPPGGWDETAVSHFHEILAALQEAFAKDLSLFRIPDVRMERVPLYVQRRPRSGYPGPRPPMSAARQCAAQFALQQLNGVYLYLEPVVAGLEALKLSHEPAGTDAGGHLATQMSAARDDGIPRRSTEAITKDQERQAKQGRTSIVRCRAIWRAFGSPVSKAKLGKKRHVRERRILSFKETARVLARLEEPNKLIIETCIATGARISEVVGLMWKHVDLKAGTIKIAQRVWHQDIGQPKSDSSRRTLGLGDLAERFREKAVADGAAPEQWIFFQKRAPERPLWDSGVRDALHQAANAEGCDFEGLGPHSFRRANITWRQQVGGSAIEASKIAGHSDLQMTGEYTFVAPERQNELTRRIQEKLAEAASTPGGPEVPPSFAETTPATTLLQ
jgi:integrase